MLDFGIPGSLLGNDATNARRGHDVPILGGSNEKLEERIADFLGG